jgi:hypothetical protein
MDNKFNYPPRREKDRDQFGYHPKGDWPKKPPSGGSSVLRKPKPKSPAGGAAKELVK